MATDLPTPDQPEVVAQDAITTGATEVHEAEVVVNREPSAAQVSPPRAEPAATSPVHEVHVKVDRKILDPSDPLAVQIPDAGRGDASLPIHQLAGPTAEEVFAAEAKKAKR